MKNHERFYIVSCEGKAIHHGVSLKQAWARYKFDKGGIDFVIYRTESRFPFSPRGRKPRWNEASFDVQDGEVVTTNCKLEIVHSEKG